MPSHCFHLLSPRLVFTPPPPTINPHLPSATCRSPTTVTRHLTASLHRGRPSAALSASPSRHSPGPLQPPRLRCLPHSSFIHLHPTLPRTIFLEHLFRESSTPASWALCWNIGSCLGSLASCLTKLNHRNNHQPDHCVRNALSLSIEERSPISKKNHQKIPPRISIRLSKKGEFFASIPCSE